MKPPENSFKGPIEGMWAELKGLTWEFPYVQVAFAAAAFVIVLVVLALLYPTVGVFLQITEILASVTNVAYQRLQAAEDFERIGHATAVGVLFLIYLPFALIGWPLYGLATLAQRLFDGLAGRLEMRPRP